jgi:hypothetical protein
VVGRATLPAIDQVEASHARALPPAAASVSPLMTAFARSKESEVIAVPIGPISVTSIKSTSVKVKLAAVNMNGVPKTLLLTSVLRVVELGLVTEKEPVNVDAFVSDVRPSAVNVDAVILKFSPPIQLLSVNVVILPPTTIDIPFVFLLVIDTAVPLVMVTTEVFAVKVMLVKEFQLIALPEPAIVIAEEPSVSVVVPEALLQPVQVIRLLAVSKVPFVVVRTPHLKGPARTHFPPTPLNVAPPPVVLPPQSTECPAPPLVVVAKNATPLPEKFHVVPATILNEPYTLRD